MLWDAPRIGLTEHGVKDLPDGPAVYVLWREGTPIHAGFVTRLTQSLKERLLMHVPAQGEDTTPGGPTHFSFFLSENPIKELGDLLPVIDATRQEREAKL